MGTKSEVTSWLGPKKDFSHDQFRTHGTLVLSTEYCTYRILVYTPYVVHTPQVGIYPASAT